MTIVTSDEIGQLATLYLIRRPIYFSHRKYEPSHELIKYQKFTLQFHTRTFSGVKKNKIFQGVSSLRVPLQLGVTLTSAKLALIFTT